MVDYTKCPQCDSQDLMNLPKGTDMKRCNVCGALFGECYTGESYGYVSNQWDTTKPEPAPENWAYFDITDIGSSGVNRRHGFYNPLTRGILQVG